MVNENTLIRNIPFCVLVQNFHFWLYIQHKLSQIAGNDSGIPGRVSTSCPFNSTCSKLILTYIWWHISSDLFASLNMMLSFWKVRVAQSLLFYLMFVDRCLSFCHFSFDLLWFTDSDYPFGIFNIFYGFLHITNGLLSLKSILFLIYLYYKQMHQNDLSKIFLKTVWYPNSCTITAHQSVEYILWARKLKTLSPNGINEKK